MITKKKRTWAERLQTGILQRSKGAKVRSINVPTAWVIIAAAVAFSSRPARADFVNITSGELTVSDGTAATAVTLMPPTKATSSAKGLTITSRYNINNNGFNVETEDLLSSGQKGVHEGRVRFTDTAAGLMYEASGKDAFVPESNALLLARLSDLTTRTTVFSSIQDFPNPGNGSPLVLGGMKGGNATFEGSLTGTLTLGDSYIWVYEIVNLAKDGPDNTGDATGFADLSFSVVPVPSPAFAGLILMGFIALVRRCGMAR